MKTKMDVTELSAGLASCKTEFMGRESHPWILQCKSYLSALIFGNEMLWALWRPTVSKAYAWIKTFLQEAHLGQWHKVVVSLSASWSVKYFDLRVSLMLNMENSIIL